MRATNSPADGRRKGQSSPMRVPVTRLQRLHANSRRCWSLRRGRQSTSGVTRCRYGIRSLDRLRHLPTLRWSDKHECRRFLLGAARLAVLQLIKLSYVPGVYVRFAAGVIKQAVGGGIDLTTFWPLEGYPCVCGYRGLALPAFASGSPSGRKTSNDVKHTPAPTLNRADHGGIHLCAPRRSQHHPK
jgi:hypothetical protein